MTTTLNPAEMPAEALNSASVRGGAVTVFTNRNRRPLSKRATLDPDGKLVVIPCAQLAHGSFQVLPADTVFELRDIISALTPSQALAHGVPRTGEQSGIVVSEAKRHSTPGSLARSLEYFAWGAGSGWLMLDVDLKELPPEFELLDLSTLAGIRAVLCGAVPELAAVPMLGLPSASAMLHRTSDGALLRGLTGARFYVPVQHAEQIEAIGKRLFDRLFLAGLGYAFISRSGRVFPRTLIDSAVWSPERLDFIGGAACGGGVEQKRGDPMVWNPNSKAWFFLDGPSAEGEQKLANTIVALRESVAKEAAVVRAAYSAARAAAGHPIAALEQEGGVISLPPHHALELADGRWITVADILAEPEKYHGQHCSDPMEPEYAPRSQHIAKIFAVGQREGPAIHSMAHGGLTYVLGRGGPVPDAADAFEALDPAPTAIVSLPSEGERLAALTGDADAAFLAELPSIRSDCLARWEVLKAATSLTDPLAGPFESIVWPLAEAASLRSEAAFRFSMKHKLAAHPLWLGLSDSDRELLLQAARLLLKRGTHEARAPRLITEATPTEWLIEDFFPVDSVVALIGPTNQGKTFISLLIACLVASAEESCLTFDGRAIRKHGAVFYFTSEDPQGLARRREAWEKANVPAHGLHLFADVPLLTGPLEDSIRFLRSAAAQAGSTPALLVIDVFTDAVIGDDNSAEVIAPAMRQARALGRMFGASVLLVHHSNKANPKEPRGSSAFGNASDVIGAVITDGKGIHMTWVKARSTPKGNDFHFHIREGVLQNGPSIQLGKSSALTESEALARAAGRVLREIHTPATTADWNAAIVQALPSCFGEKVTSAYRRTKLSRARKQAIVRKWAAEDKNKFTVGPEAVPEDAFEPGNLDDLPPADSPEALV
jgi:hypothetical protein